MSHEPVPLIYNPRAGGGKGTSRMRTAEQALAARGVVVDPKPTEGPGGARPIAERLAAQGARRILVAGGDGTISEAADGVLASGAAVELGFLPGGTGNSFLHHFGVRTLDEAVARIAAGKVRAVDAALARWDGGERHFVNVFGVGFAAKVCDYANRRLKWVGAQAYNVAVMPELARLRSPMTRLTLDDREIEEPIALVLVCNTAYTGTAMHAAPGADASDGLLDVVALRKVGRIRLLKLFSMLFEGRHIGEPDILFERAARVRVDIDSPSPLLGDGEVYGSTPCDVHTLRGVLKVLV